jgi:hypothetical protein
MLIRDQFGISYHPFQVGRILKACGWSTQKPAHRATQGGREGYPAMAGGALAPDQKKAIEEERILVFVDQSGFYLLTGVVRTYAPVGQTPIIRAPSSRDHLSAMGGITPEGKLYLMVQERAYRGRDVVRFLRHLLRHIPGKLLII